MSFKPLKTALLCLAAAPFWAGGSAAQTLAQLATAPPAAMGEGAVFMLAGNDAFRTGVALRFRLAGASDIGFQLGFDREVGMSSIGGGVDCKLTFLRAGDSAPLSLALDVSGGMFESEERERLELALGLVASGAVAASRRGAIEPYALFAVAMRRCNRTAAGVCRTWGGACPADGARTSAVAVVRAGVKVPVSKDSQFLAEISLDGKTLIGGAFNLVF